MAIPPSISYIFNDGTKVRVAIRMIVLAITGFVASLSAEQVVSIQLALEAVVALFVTVVPPVKMDPPLDGETPPNTEAPSP